MDEALREFIEQIIAGFTAGLGVDSTGIFEDRDVFLAVADYAAARVTNIQDTTRKLLNEKIESALRSNPQLDVNGLQEQIQLLRDKWGDEIFGQSRSLTIAATETVGAYNRGAITRFERMGAPGVEVFDGTLDDVCETANGSKWTLETAAEHPYGHPHCQRDFLPLDPEDGPFEWDEPHPDEID